MTAQTHPYVSRWATLTFRLKALYGRMHALRRADEDLMEDCSWWQASVRCLPQRLDGNAAELGECSSQETGLAFSR